MKNPFFALLVLLAFVVGVGGTLFVVKAGGKPVPVVACNAEETACRAQLRERGLQLLAVRRENEARETFRIAAFAGDAVSQFELGWLHEQAYRAKVGRALATKVSVDEEGFHGVEGLPTGEAFVELIRRHSDGADPNGSVLADRTLAYLWYAAAARSSFAPAMNNLGAMYQFGMLGRIDRVKGRDWYVRAHDLGNPVAAFNLARLVNLDAPELDDCRYVNQWLPLTLRPKPEDMAEPILTQTRFRGRELAPGLRELIRAQAQAVGGGGASEEPGKPNAGMILALLAEAGRSQKSEVFDDETPEEANTVPEWKGVPAGTSARRNCDDSRPDPRQRLAEEAARAARAAPHSFQPPRPHVEAPRKR